MEAVKIQDGFAGQRLVVLGPRFLKAVQNRPLVRQLAITDIGFFPKARHHYRCRQDGCGQYILIYCLEGQGYLAMANQCHLVPARHYFIIPPDRPHSYWADQQAPWSIYWLHFTGTTADDLYGKYQTASGQWPVVPVGFQDRRLLLFAEILELLTGSSGHQALEYSCLLALEWLGSFIFAQDAGPKLKTQAIVQQIIADLRQNRDQKITVTDLARRFGYSVSYLFAIFKRQTGYSPIHFFNLLKVEKACEYLRLTNYSIKEICFKLGCDDPLYFSRLFKKHMGIGPRDYRRQADQKPGGPQL